MSIRKSVSQIEISWEKLLHCTVRKVHNLSILNNDQVFQTVNDTGLFSFRLQVLALIVKSIKSRERVMDKNTLSNR